MPRGVKGSKAPHGTLTRLTTHGCRCRLCLDALNNYRHRTGRARPLAEYLAAIAARHGTESRYRGGCRCGPCTVAANEARSERRRLNGPSPNAKHGKASTYSNGCRCDECRRANTEKFRAYRARRVDAQSRIVRP